jgi:hypothetical protein
MAVMTWTSFSAGDRGDDQGGYVVRRPRATDALGKALRSTYAQATSLPDDMHRMVERLDRTGGRRCA